MHTTLSLTASRFAPKKLIASSLLALSAFACMSLRAQTTYINPLSVPGGAMADPAAIDVNHTLYIYATGKLSQTQGNGATAVPMTSTTDFNTFTTQVNTLVPPDWVDTSQGDFWGVDVIYDSHNSRYIMYFGAAGNHTYTGVDPSSDGECIGTAVSGSPNGPFTAPNGPPLACAWDYAYIDPAPFTNAAGVTFLFLGLRNRQRPHPSAPTRLQRPHKVRQRFH